MSLDLDLGNVFPLSLLSQRTPTKYRIKKDNRKGREKVKKKPKINVKKTRIWRPGGQDSHIRDQVHADELLLLFFLDTNSSASRWRPTKHDVSDLTHYIEYWTSDSSTKSFRTCNGVAKTTPRRNNGPTEARRATVEFFTPGYVNRFSFQSVLHFVFSGFVWQHISAGLGFCAMPRMLVFTPSVSRNRD